MIKKQTYLFTLLMLWIWPLFAQIDADSTNFSIYYSSPKDFVIGGIDIVGVKNLDKNMLLQYSGIEVGDKITVPGDKITEVIKKYYKQGLFSDIRISATKVVDDKIFLEFYFQVRPKLTKVNYIGLKKSEIDDIEEKVTLDVGRQVVENYIVSAERLIKRVFHEKGFLDTEVNIVQRDDPDRENSVILDIHVDKKEKIKISEIVFKGNNEVPMAKLEKAMKKTKAKKLKNFFRSKKFQEDKYKEDLINLVTKYNELGYRDAVVTGDTIIKNQDENTVKIVIDLEEGQKYYFRDIKWVGNTVYPSEILGHVMGITPGDVYNQKLLSERLNEDDDAVSNLYLDKGYLFFNLNPIEVNIDGDSIDLEMRMIEGKQATINRVDITGNTKTHEQVARRELYTLPGDLFSKTKLMRSYRQLASLGHFDPERINPQTIPHIEDGTVDLNYELVEKANDQIELSGGWGYGMFVGSVGLKFSNFSMRNIFNKEAWRPLPSGDGQTLSIRAQTNGSYYKQYSLTFQEPWLGGNKPNNLSVSLYYSKLSRSQSNYNLANSYSNPYYGGYGYSPYGYGGYSPYGYGGYSPYGYGGYSPYGYGSYGGYGYTNPYGDPDQEPDQWQITYGASLGYGYRLSWPDDYFTVYHELSFQHYDLKNWYYYFLNSGNINDFSFKTVFSRNSIVNPLYPRRGSTFSLSLEITPPYSVLNGKDYSDPDMRQSEKYNFLEYHKWMFDAEWYTSLDPAEKLVFRSKYEFGMLGYFNENRKSPLEGFKMGGDGMSGYDIYGSDNIAMRGYANGSLTPPNGGNIYSKVTMELRYPVTLSESATVYALAFLEAGNAWYDFKGFSPFNLKRSAGVGVRFWLPMFGLLGVDWGYGFDPANSGASKSNGSQFHFVIGQQF